MNAQKIDVLAVLIDAEAALCHAYHTSGGEWSEICRSNELALQKARSEVVSLIEGSKMLIESESPKQCFQNRKESEARKLIRAALANIGPQS